MAVKVREVAGAVRVSIGDTEEELALDQAGDLMAALGAAMKKATPNATKPESGGVELLAQGSGVLTASGHVGLWFSVQSFPNVIVVIPKQDATKVIDALYEGLEKLQR